jgi:CubicO group peptidase (beta-lactamase class C family)
MKRAPAHKLPPCDVLIPSVNGGTTMSVKAKLRKCLLLAAIASLCLVVVSRADPLVSLPRGDAKAAGFAPEKLLTIPATLKQAVDKKQLAGASALIARNGKIVFFTSVGNQDVESNVPLSEGTIFRIASMSKPITSVAVMILVDDGKLSVTDPLAKFVPEFKELQVLVPAKDGKSYELVKASRAITIHDLLTHSSGISYRLFDKPFVGKMYAEAGVSDGLSETPGTIGDNIRKLAKLPLVCQPGSAWEYGLNTDVLGYIVEVVSGQSLEQFCRERIFHPLRMTDTCFVLPKAKHARLSALYAAAPDKAITRVGKEPVTAGPVVYSATYPTNEDSKYYSGGAGLVATTGDYFRFCQMLLNKGELDGVRILKPETVARMTQNQLGDLRIMFPGGDLMGYGFGVLSEKGKADSKDPAGVGTFSWGGAFGTSFWIDPKNEIVGVYMSQSFPPDFTLAGEFKRLTYAALAESK